MQFPINPDVIIDKRFLRDTQLGLIYILLYTVSSTVIQSIYCYQISKTKNFKEASKTAFLPIMKIITFFPILEWNYSYYIYGHIKSTEAKLVCFAINFLAILAIDFHLIRSYWKPSKKTPEVKSINQEPGHKNPDVESTPEESIKTPEVKSKEHKPFEQFEGTNVDSPSPLTITLEPFNHIPPEKPIVNTPIKREHIILEPFRASPPLTTPSNIAESLLRRDQPSHLAHLDSVEHSNTAPPIFSEKDLKPIALNVLKATYKIFLEHKNENIQDNNIKSESNSFKVSISSFDAVFSSKLISPYKKHLNDPSFTINLIKEGKKTSNDRVQYNISLINPTVVACSVKEAHLNCYPDGLDEKNYTNLVHSIIRIHSKICEFSTFDIPLFTTILSTLYTKAINDFKKITIKAATIDNSEIIYSNLDKITFYPTDNPEAFKYPTSR